MTAAAAECSSALVDAWPASATLRMVKGDPFAFRIVLRGADGEPADLSAWTFGGVVASDRVRLDWEWQADDTGVNLWLRGEETYRLSTLRPGRFDVAALPPSAGEGSTILSGEVLVKPRVGNPLRNDPDAAPRDEVPA